MRTAFLIGLMLFTGCASTVESLTIVTMAQMAPQTESGEVFAGCLGYYAFGRKWPTTAGEVAQGLKIVQREPKYLPALTDLALVETDGALNISYRSSDGSKMGMRLGKPERTNHAPKPPSGLPPGRDSP